MNSTTNTPMGDKVQVSKNLHDQIYQNFMRALDTASVIRLIIASIPETVDKQDIKKAVQTFGDIQAASGLLLKELAVLTDFLDTLHFSVMEVKADAGEVDQS